MTFPPDIVQNGPPQIDDATAREMYRVNKTGPYTTSGPIQFVFIDTPKMSPRASSLIEAYKQQSPAEYLREGSDLSVIEGYAKQKEVLAKYLGSDHMAAAEIVFGGGLMFSQQHPLSRGYVELKSKNPWEYPAIDFRYATNPLDLDWKIEAFKFGRRVIATPAVQELQPVERTPGPSVTSDEQLKSWVRGSMSTIFHSCCTNPMQPRELGGVADSKAVVYGTSNLRVVDASLIPLIPATHIQSTVYAVAEKIADEIKKSLV